MGGKNLNGISGEFPDFFNRIAIGDSRYDGGMDLIKAFVFEN